MLSYVLFMRLHRFLDGNVRVCDVALDFILIYQQDCIYTIKTQYL